MNYSFYIITNVYKVDIQEGEEIVTTRDLPEYHKNLKKFNLGTVVAIINKMSCLIMIEFKPEDFFDFQKVLGDPESFIYPFVFISSSELILDNLSNSSQKTQRVNVKTFLDE